MVFLGLMRPAFGLAVMLIFFIVAMGQFRFIFLILNNYVFRTIGKITFPFILTYPLIILITYASSRTGFYLSWYNVIFISFANMVLETIIGVLLYLFIEYPVQVLLHNNVMKYLSHEKILRDYYEKTLE